MNARRHLERPSGMNDFVQDEMLHRRSIQQKLIAEFEAWGYRMLETPLLEYAEIFAKGIHRGEEEQLYRMFDPSGRTLVLRPEMTTPVARIVASTLADHPLPLRLGYWAKTYRGTSGKTHDRAEMTQAGVELIGESTADGDAEVVALMISALRKLGVREFRLAIGHMGFVQAMLRTLPLGIQEALRRALIEKNLVAFDQIIIDANEDIDEDMKRALRQLPRMRGGWDAIAGMREVASHPDAVRACDELADLWDALVAHGAADFIHIDLGLYLDHEYYSGPVVEGYADSLGQPICFGGRYDRLLEQFDRRAFATGCVLHVERLMTILPLLADQRPLVQLYYEPACRDRALAFSRDLRERSYVVTSQRIGVGTRVAPAPVSSREVRVGVIGGDGSRLTGDSLLQQMYDQVCVSANSTIREGE